MRFLLALFLILTAVAATSQLSQKQTAHKKNPQTNVDKPAIDQTVTDAGNRIEAIMKQVLSVVSQIASEQHKDSDRAQGSKEKTDTLLVVFTFFLVIVGGLQWWTLRKHETWMAKNVAFVTKIASAASDNAAAANKNAEFSRLNAEATKESATAAKISAEVARDSITLTHRPKLVVREIYMFPSATNSNVTINYTISNSGSTPATIIESLIDVQPVPSGNAEPLREDRSNMIGENPDNVLANPENTLTIEPGGFRRYRYTSEVPHQMLIDSHYLEESMVPRPRLFFRGRVVYRDEIGTKRQMAFYRYYDFQTRRFCRLGDPDYEYED